MLTALKSIIYFLLIIISPSSCISQSDYRAKHTGLDSIIENNVDSTEILHQYQNFLP